VSPGANGLNMAIDIECVGKEIRNVQNSTFGINKKSLVIRLKKN